MYQKMNSQWSKDHDPKPSCFALASLDETIGVSEEVKSKPNGAAKELMNGEPR